MYQDEDILAESDFGNDLSEKRKAFYKQFDETFKLKEKGFDEKMQEFARTTFSNLVGGIAYFYGSSLVQSKHNPVCTHFLK